MECYLALLSWLLACLLCWALLTYFSTILPTKRNILTYLDTFFVISLLLGASIQVFNSSGCYLIILLQVIGLLLIIFVGPFPILLGWVWYALMMTNYNMILNAVNSLCLVRIFLILKVRFFCFSTYKLIFSACKFSKLEPFESVQNSLWLPPSGSTGVFCVHFNVI